MSDDGVFVRIAALDALRVGAASSVRGRVFEMADEHVMLADPSGTVWVQVASGAVSPGALLSARVRRVERGFALEAFDTLAEPLRGGLHPDGDVRRLLAPAHGGGPSRLARLEQRARCLRAIRGFFDTRGFVEVETPSLVVNPGMDTHLDAFRVGEPAEGRWLATSPEYPMKRLVAAGMERIYQLTRGYRRDESGELHEPEFTIAEWYRAFAGADETMADTEALVAHVVAACHDGASVVTRGEATIDVRPPWPRLTVREAVATYAGRDLDRLLADPDELFHVLGFVVQPRLGAATPVWLVDWPIELASLARAKPTDPRVAERFEAYAAGVELCNGFGELTDPEVQRRRFEADARAREAAGKDGYPIDERFLRALEDGLPACSGNALGVDRLVMLATGASTIGDVRAFSVRDV